MTAQIVPLRRLPFALSLLDYETGELEGRLKKGQLVKIPLRGGTEFGLVCSLGGQPKTNKKITLKKITEIIFEQPLIDGRQFDFLAEIAELYRAPLGFVIKSALLPLKKTKLSRAAEFLAQPAAKARPPVKPAAFFSSDQDEEKKYLEENIPADGQTLILVPEVWQIEETLKKLSSKNSARAIAIRGEIGEREFFDLWLKIRADRQALVVGTRKALFLPWTDLAAIFLMDEGNPDHKSWDMAPRFHARDAALILARHFGAALHLLGATPSVETMYFAQKGVYEGRKIGLRSFTPPRFIDLRQERRGGNFGLLSEAVLGAIRQTSQGDILLFLNRRGTAGFASCRDCGFVFRCPDCRRPFVYYKKDERLLCHFCRKNEALPPLCPKCGGPNFIFTGPGTSAAEAELKKNLIPLGAREITRLDSESDEATAKEAAPQRGPVGIGRQKIFIGTEFALSRIDWPRLRLAAFLEADTPLYLPEYRAAENLWQTLRQVQSRLPANTPLFLQAADPNQNIFQNLNQPEKFYQEQLAERRLFGYPPFNFLLKIFNGWASEAEAERASAAEFQRLTGLTKASDNIIINPPLEASPRFHQGRFWRIIVVKIPYQNYKRDTRRLIASLSDNWKIDLNPDSLLAV